MKRILVIDDSEVNLYLIQTIFEEDKDIQVDIECDSTKALSRLREGSYQTIILDLMMPHIDGFDILKSLKSDPHLEQIPVIVVSAKHDEESISRAQSFSINGYIKKPIKMNVIENIVRKSLNMA